MSTFGEGGILFERIIQLSPFFSVRSAQALAGSPTTLWCLKEVEIGGAGKLISSSYAYHHY